LLQYQKIISCLLCIAVILGTMFTITCLAVGSEGDGTGDGAGEGGGEVIESSQPDEITSEESSDFEGEDSNVEDEESTDESMEESMEEPMEESSEEEQDTEEYYYYAGDESYPPYTGSRVLKNPNIVEDDEDNKKVDDKNINDWSDVARRWVFVPILFTLLSIGGLVGFNMYANKQNGTKDSSNRKREEELKGRNRRNFNRPKH